MPRSQHQCLAQDNSLIESLQSQPPVIPDPVISCINQANQAKPIYPTVRGPPVPVPARQHSMSSEEADFLETHVPAYCYYPENIYLGDALPTRTPRTLQAFKNHCRLQYDQGRVTLVLDQPLDHLREFTSSPLNFQNLLWKGRTTVTHYSIFEEYYWIY